MKVSDQQAGWFFLGVSGFACFEAYRLELGAPGAPLSGFFPFLSAAILAVLSVACVIGAHRKAREKDGKKESRRSGKKMKGSAVVLFILALLAYTFFLEQAGFLICTAFLMLIMLRLGSAGWIPSLALSLSVAFLSYYVFNKLLGANLPRGWWGF